MFLAYRGIKNIPYKFSEKFRLSKLRKYYLTSPKSFESTFNTLIYISVLKVDAKYVFPRSIQVALVFLHVHAKMRSTNIVTSYCHKNPSCNYRCSVKSVQFGTCKIQ